MTFEPGPIPADPYTIKRDDLDFDVRLNGMGSHAGQTLVSYLAVAVMAATVVASVIAVARAAGRWARG